MRTDRQTLNFTAAVLCGLGSLAALIGGLAGGRRRDTATRAAVLSALFGVIGSAAWAASAYQDMVDARRPNLRLVDAA